MKRHISLLCPTPPGLVLSRLLPDQEGVGLRSFRLVALRSARAPAQAVHWLYYRRSTWVARRAGLRHKGLS